MVGLRLSVIRTISCGIYVQLKKKKNYCTFMNNSVRGLAALASCPADVLGYFVPNGSSVPKELFHLWYSWNDAPKCLRCNRLLIDGSSLLLHIKPNTKVSRSRPRPRSLTCGSIFCHISMHNSKVVLCQKAIRIVRTSFSAVNNLQQRMWTL